MRAGSIAARRFRNIESLDLDLPDAGAVLLGPNGQGKTNVLEALYYPVLLRSLRGARDAELVRHGDEGFHLRLRLENRTGAHEIEAGFVTAGRRKRVALDGAPVERVADALGTWLAVAFLPGDVSLISGGASERRQFLDRVLALSSPTYLRALRQYRAAVDQRNAALRRRESETAWAFDPAVAAAGAAVVTERLAWIDRWGPAWTAACAALGEPMAVGIRYRGHAELADPAAWPAALEQRRHRDTATGTTNVGPHRDDLVLTLADVPLRVAGSTGQQRTAAVALKLCERDTRAGGRRSPPSSSTTCSPNWTAMAEPPSRRAAARARQAGVRHRLAPSRRTPPSLGLPVAVR
ncbi:MAG: DNA replication and repair protein RecF [Gemmatimonadales bacterium]